MSKSNEWAEAYRPLRLGRSKVETRLVHCLRNAGYANVLEALRATDSDLLEIKMFGAKCLARLRAVPQEIINAAFEEEVETWNL